MSENELKDVILEVIRNHPPMNFPTLAQVVSAKAQVGVPAVTWELRTMLEYRYIQYDLNDNIVEVTK